MVILPNVMEAAKDSVRIFVPWTVSSTCLYALAFMAHMKLVQVFAFLAVFLSVLFFVLHYRSMGAHQKALAKYGARISAWSTLVAAGLYLLLSPWR